MSNTYTTVFLERTETVGNPMQVGAGKGKLGVAPPGSGTDTDTAWPTSSTVKLQVQLAQPPANEGDDWGWSDWIDVPTISFTANGVKDVDIMADARYRVTATVAGVIAVFSPSTTKIYYL